MADTLKKFFLLRHCLSKNSSLTTVLKFVINFSQLLQVFSLTVILFLLLQLLCYSPCQEVLTYHIRWSTYLLLATLYQDQVLDLCRLEIWQNPCYKVIRVIKVSFQQQSLVLYLLTVHTSGRLSDHGGDNNRSVKKAITITRIMSHAIECNWHANETLSRWDLVASLLHRDSDDLHKPRCD